MVVRWRITASGSCTPQTPLPALPALQPGDLLVVGGDAPEYRYAMALRYAFVSHAGAVAVYDKKISGAVVVQSHSSQYTVGQVVPVSNGGSSAQSGNKAPASKPPRGRWSGRRNYGRAPAHY